MGWELCESQGLSLSFPSAHRLPQTVLPHWLSSETAKNSSSKESNPCLGQICSPSLDDGHHTLQIASVCADPEHAHTCWVSVSE